MGRVLRRSAISSPHTISYRSGIRLHNITKNCIGTKTKRDRHIINYRKYKILREFRKEDTAKYAKQINVEKFVTFTALISDEHQGGFNFDLRQFLSDVRPHWVDKAEKAG
jgi:hypothetical protein